MKSKDLTHDLWKLKSDKVVDQTTENKNIWVYENNQQETALERVKAMLRSSPEFSEDDLLISADMDEMVSRDVLQSLKHCQLRHGVLSAALIMPMGNFDLAFRWIMMFVANLWRPRYHILPIDLTTLCLISLTVLGELKLCRWVVSLSCFVSSDVCLHWHSWSCC